MKSSSLEGVLRRMAVPAAERKKAHEFDAKAPLGYDPQRVYKAVTGLLRTEGTPEAEPFRVSLLTAFKMGGLDLEATINPDAVMAEHVECLRLTLRGLMVPLEGVARANEVFATVMTDAQRDRAAAAAQEFLGHNDDMQIRTEMRRRLADVFGEAGFDLINGVNRKQAAIELVERTAATAEVSTKIIPTDATTRQLPTEPEPQVPVAERPTDILPADATTREPPAAVTDIDVEMFLRTVYLHPDPESRRFSLYSSQPGTITFTITYDDGAEVTTEGEPVADEPGTFLTPHPDVYDQIRRITAVVVRDGATVAEGTWERDDGTAEPAAAQPDDLHANPGQTILGTGEEGPDSTEETKEQVPFMNSALHVHGEVVTVVLRPDVDGRACVTLTLDDGTKVEARQDMTAAHANDAVQPENPDPAFHALFNQIAGIDVIIAIPAGRTVARMDLQYMSGTTPIRRSAWLPPGTPES